MNLIDCGIVVSMYGLVITLLGLSLSNSVPNLIGLAGLTLYMVGLLVVVYGVWSKQQ